jgi:hypothetical protein
LNNGETEVKLGKQGGERRKEKEKKRKKERGEREMGLGKDSGNVNKI